MIAGEPIVGVVEWNNIRRMEHSDVSESQALYFTV